MNYRSSSLTLYTTVCSVVLGILLLFGIAVSAFAQYGSGLYGSSLYGQEVGDVTAPTLSLVTPVSTPTTDTTPNLTFSSTEAGSITYGGSCTFSTNSATAGSNLITLNTLAVGLYNNCTIVVTDAAGNASEPLDINSFRIQAVPDTTPPLIAVMASADGTEGYTGQVTTNEGTGTLYWVVNQNASAPSVAVVKAGESQPVSGVGMQNVSGSGLTQSTTYYLHAVHTDAAGNDSDIQRSAAFTTSAAGDKFVAGERVRVTGGTTQVYNNASSLGSYRGTQSNGSRGKTVGSERDGFGGNRFIFVNFANGYDGFVDVVNLASVSAPTLTAFNTEKGRVARGVGTSTLSHKDETDINDDGIDDREERRISSLINKVRTDRERPNTLRLHSETAVVREFRNVTEAEIQTDNEFVFSLGLYEFRAEVEPGSTETVTIYLDDTYDVSDWTYRKFNPLSEQYSVLDVTYGTADVDGSTVTTVRYEIEDNGPLDFDDRLGFIYDPAGPAEAESSGSSGGGGGGGSSSRGSRTSGGSGGSSSSGTDDESEGVVVPSLQEQVSVDTSIPSWFTFESNISFIQPELNDPSAVRFLAIFLNDFEGESLMVDEVYGPADVEAVRRFQNKYKQEILDIWNLDEATGFVGITTRLKLNFLLKGQTAECPAFTEFNGGLTGVFQSDEVQRTQEILIQLDLFAGPATGFWDPFTHEAMVDFQELFHEVMLDPWNITEGTGYKYKTTNKFLNYFVGCDTPPVELEGVGSFDF